MFIILLADGDKGYLADIAVAGVGKTVGFPRRTTETEKPSGVYVF
jgi:hypothetical protein